MSGPVKLGDLLAQLQEVYRPSLRGHWQRRLVNRIRRWLDREEVDLFWTEDEEAAATGDRLPLPGRVRPPRWLFVDGQLSPEAAVVAEVLTSHIATVAGLMEAGASRELPPRWRSLLTPRQGQVAVLAAEGASNEEIAVELGIAPRTVARLLQETFTRLGTTNRQALAAECALGRPPTPFLDNAGTARLSSGHAGEPLSAEDDLLPAEEED